MSNLKVLVVFYSRTGHTKKVALLINEKIGAKVQEITVFGNKKSYIWCYQTMTKKPAIINPIDIDLTSYDLVIIGGPTWGSNVSSPIQTFLKEYNEKLKSVSVAFFCSKISSNSDILFEQMKSMSKKSPVATLDITNKKIKGQNFDKIVSEFVNKLKSNN
jgi:flavodoxin